MVDVSATITVVLGREPASAGCETLPDGDGISGAVVDDPTMVWLDVDAEDCVEGVTSSGISLVGCCQRSKVVSTITCQCALTLYIRHNPIGQVW